MIDYNYTDIKNVIKNGDQSWRETIVSRYSTKLQEEGERAMNVLNEAKTPEYPEGSPIVPVLLKGFNLQRQMAENLLNRAEAIRSGSKTIRETFENKDQITDEEAEELAELYLRINQ